MPGDDLYLRKAAALLHDPPHKAWVVLGEAGWRGRGGHEAEARRLAERVLRGTPLEGALGLLESEGVRNADRWAAAEDRQRLERIRENPWGWTAIANPFNPRYTFNSAPPAPLKVEEFAGRLNSVLGEAGNKGMAYHLLYALLEPLWWLTTRSMGPADTRIPHHTVFDHLYATASTVNLVPSGQLVYLDLAGIQGFVAPARRLADYWAGSWLVSAMMWYTVAEVVEIYGPDILLMPTARLNPFYYYWLSGRVKGKARGELERVAGALLPDGWPLQPVMPGTVLLALPRGPPPNGSSWREYFERRYREIWSHVVDAAAGEVSRMLGEALGDEEAARRVAEVVRLVRGAPPLRLIVNIVPHRFEGRGSTEYAEKVREVTTKKPVDTLKVAMGSTVDWGSLTEPGGEGQAVYRVCNMCYQLPGLVRLVYRDDKLIVEVWDEGAYNELGAVKKDKSIGALLRPGEALCPYCLVKRAVSRTPVLEKVLREVFGHSTGFKGLVFPSTGDMAALDYKLRLLDLLLENGDKAKELLDKIKENLDKLKGEAHIEAMAEYLYRKHKASNITDKDRIPRIPLEKLNKAVEDAIYGGKLRLGDNPLWRAVYMLVIGEAEPFLLGSAARLVHEAIREVLGAPKGLGRPKLYYAVVRADGDNIGETLKGRLATVCSAKEYYELLYRSLRKHGGRLPPRGEEELPRIASQLAERSSASSTGNGDATYIVPTPSYHAAVSRALMAAAVRDIYAVREAGGFVVYAGGDDLAILLPTYLGGESPVLKAVKETRRAYWGLHMYPPGFIVDDVLGVVPALLAGGRSYGVRLAHYRDPMRWEIERAADLEGKAKKVEVDGARKDSTAIGYGRAGLAARRRGGEGWATALIPNWCIRGSESPAEHIERTCCYYKPLGKIWELIESGAVSASFLIDVASQEGFIHELRRRGGAEIALKALEYIYGRNTRRGAVDASVLRELAAYNDMFYGDRWLPLEALKALLLLRKGVR